MIKNKERIKDFLQGVVNQRQKELRTIDIIDVRSFYSCNARADLAETILDLLENGFHDIDYKVRSGDKVFNPETQTFEEDKGR
jgi:hypothetical protein